MPRHPDYSEQEWRQLTPAAQARCWRATGQLVRSDALPAEDPWALALSGAERMAAACALSMQLHDAIAPGPVPWMQTPLERQVGALSFRRQNTKK